MEIIAVIMHDHLLIRIRLHFIITVQKISVVFNVLVVKAIYCQWLLSHTSCSWCSIPHICWNIIFCLVVYTWMMGLQLNFCENSLRPQSDSHGQKNRHNRHTEAGPVQSISKLSSSLGLQGPLGSQVELIFLLLLFFSNDMILLHTISL